MQAPTVELRAVSRTFGPLRAVDGVDITLRPGELRALIGENGAGKSTALKLASGHLRPTSGTVLIDGRALSPCTPQEAIARGVGLVHQHFMLVDSFSALENLVLGAEIATTWGRLDQRSARARAERVAEQAGFSIDLDARAGDLAVGDRQRLEILRVLFRGARAILLDEPTAVLTPTEVVELYAVLRKLAADGATLAVVSHRLDEVVRYCDEVSVMRAGRLVHEEALRAGAVPDGSPRTEGPSEQATTEEQAAAERTRAVRRLTLAIMGGRPPAELTRGSKRAEGAPALRLSAVCLSRRSGSSGLCELELSVGAGEIVGIAGVEGNGQREIARVLAGLETVQSGQIELGGAPLPRRPGAAATIRAVREAGLVVVQEDRHRDELLLEATVADNLVLGDLGHVEERAAVARRLGRFEVHPRDPARLAAELSGGNQQKLVMARALDRSPRVLVVSQPTRGVDVGTARTIHQALVDVAKAGTAVLVISADLDELRLLCGRIVVLRAGRFVAELDPEAGSEAFGRAMLGTVEPPPAAARAVAPQREAT